MLGDSVYTVALAWLILQVASPAVLAISMICLGIPRGVLLLLGGVATDYFTPRQVMFCSHGIRAILVTGLAILTAAGQFQHWHFYVISTAFGIADAFFWPASGSILATLVPPGELVQANVVNSIGEQATTLTGPIIGGLLVYGLGPVPALFCNAATFLIAACTILAAPKTVKPTPGRITVGKTLGDIRTGLAYSYSKPGIRVILLIISASALAYSGLFGVGLPTLAKTFPQASFGLGLMIASWGLGQFLGALSAGYTGLPRRWGLLIIGMAFCEGAVFGLLGFIPNLWIVSALFVVLGFGVAYSSDVALPTWIQKTTPREMLGRVNSIMDIPRVTLEPISMIMMGTLASINVRLAFGAASLPMLFVAMTLLASKQARNLATEPDDGRPAGSLDVAMDEAR